MKVIIVGIEDTDHIVFSVSPNVSSESAEFANILVNELNSIDPVYRWANGHTDKISSMLYSQIKTDVTNDYMNYIAGKTLTDTVANEAWKSSYNFDWTNGGIPDISLPTFTQYVEKTLGGFKLSNPYMLNENGMFASVEDAKAAGAQYASMGYNGASAAVRVSNCGYGNYVIYNGEIYYFVGRSHGPANEGAVDLTVSDYPDKFINANGISLKDAGCNTVRGLLAGYFICTDPNATTNYPSIVTDNELTDTVGGGLISIQPTQAEQIISDAIKSGIMSDPTLTIGENGEIIGADDKTISDIEKELESMGVVDKNMLGKLSNIEQKIAAISQSIANAKAAKFELDKDSADVEYFSIFHTGLAESAEFVSKFEIVNQCRELLAGVLNASKYGTTAPNFKFYYDSNKDGIIETYNALDLSFLDTPLSNNNLVDKSRFQKVMTVREFIQVLMILICYVAFGVKMLRKLPGLVTGGESATDYGLEVKAIERSEILRSIGKRGG